MIVLRAEGPRDVAGVRRLNELAFGGAGEARLVDLLRERGAVLRSLVACLGETVVGHILFTPLRRESGRRARPRNAGPRRPGPRRLRDALRGAFKGVFADVVFAITGWSDDRRFIGPFEGALG